MSWADEHLKHQTYLNTFKCWSFTPFVVCSAEKLFILQSGSKWHIFIVVETSTEMESNQIEPKMKWNYELTRRTRDQMIDTSREFICSPWAQFSFSATLSFYFRFCYLIVLVSVTPVPVLLVTCAFILNIVQYLISFLKLWDRLLIHNVSNGVSAFQFTAING